MTRVKAVCEACNGAGVNPYCDSEANPCNWCSGKGYKLLIYRKFKKRGQPRLIVGYFGNVLPKDRVPCTIKKVLIDRDNLISFSEFKRRTRNIKPRAICPN